MRNRPEASIPGQFQLSQQNKNLLDPNSFDEPYAIYSCNITQEGVADPVATVFRNSFRHEPAWLREGIGIYSLNGNDIFPLGKVQVFTGAHSAGTGARNLIWTYASRNRLIFRMSVDGAYTDGQLLDMAIEVRVHLF